MEKTLKDLLKPPFSVDDNGMIRDRLNYPICELTLHSPLIISDFVLHALNEKAAREWGARKRWELHKFETRPYRAR